ncbi:MAG: hypothetical protein Q8L95_11660 [Burkholderiales bacterium]|nr:hypothetical protein [Burkholderiales bacterium]
MLFALFIGLLAIAILLQASVRSRESARHIRPLDLGVVFAWVVFMYGGFPLLGIMLAGWGVGGLHDSRLGGELPGDAQVVRVGLMYFLFLAGFAVTYGFERARSRVAQPIGCDRSTSRDVVVVVTFLVCIKAAMIVIRAVLDIAPGEDYLATYIEFSGQPLIVQQLVGVLSASDLSAVILVVVVVIAKNPKLHGIVAAFIVMQIAATLLIGGSRSQAFACALAYVVARSMYDRRLRFSSIVAAGVAGLVLFLIAGALRQAESDEFSGLYLLQGGEFLSVFYNSLDLAERLQDLDTTALRAGMYLVDLLRLVPRQIVGDLKLDPASFYVSTFYPDFSEAGGGLAFGAIAESTVGFGPAEALIRGALIGYLYARVRNYCLQQQLSVLRGFVYTWFVVLSYQAIRDTTFSVFPRFVFQVAPLLFAIWLTGTLRIRHTRSWSGRNATGAVRHPTIHAPAAANPR